MNNVRAIQKLNKRELEEGISTEGSWHTDYRDTAFIYVGGLPFDLSEGDIITVFSQFGEPVWIKLARDKESGKSRGFCWIKYEDQRSTDLAVDNLGGATIMGRMLRVDHARYKPRDDEDMRDNTMGELDPDGDEWRKKRRKTESESESESEDDRPLLPEEIELQKLINNLEDDDPMKASMVQRKQEEVEAAVKKYEKAKRKEKRQEKHHSRRHRRDDSQDRHRDRRRIKARGDENDDADRRTKHRDGSRNRDRYRNKEREREDRGRHSDRYSSEEEAYRHSRNKQSSRQDRSPDREREKHPRRRERS